MRSLSLISCEPIGKAFGSVSLQVGDRSSAGFHQLVRLNTEHVVPRSRRGLHLGPLQQVRVDEHTQLLGVTERRHGVIGFGNTIDEYRPTHPGTAMANPSVTPSTSRHDESVVAFKCHLHGTAAEAGRPLV